MTAADASHSKEGADLSVEKRRLGELVSAYTITIELLSRQIRTINWCRDRAKWELEQLENADP